SLVIESGSTRSVSRDVLAHAGVPHYAVHAYHARRVAWLLRSRSQGCRWEPACPMALCTRTSGPALTGLLHVLPGCTASGDMGASTRLWPPAPSRPLRRRGAGLAPARRARATGEPQPRRCRGGTRRWPQALRSAQPCVTEGRLCATILPSVSA